MSSCTATSNVFMLADYASRKTAFDKLFAMPRDCGDCPQVQEDMHDLVIGGPVDPLQAAYELIEKAALRCADDDVMQTVLNALKAVIIPDLIQICSEERLRYAN